MAMYQLIIRRKTHVGMSLSELFTRGRTCVIEAFPCEIPLNEVEFAPSGLSVRVSHGKKEGAVTLCVEGWKGDFSLNGECVGQSAAIQMHNGDVLTVGECQFSLYRMLERNRIAWGTRFFGGAGRAIVALLLIAEVMGALFFPWYLRRSTLFERDSNLHALNLELDTCRRRVAALQSNDVLVATYYKALNEEVSSRVRYVRRYSERLSAEQIEQQRQNVRRLSDMCVRLSKLPAVAADGEVIKVDLDIPVRKILENKL